MAYGSLFAAAISVLGRVRLVDAREVAALELLAEAERLAMPSREAAGSERDLVEVEVDEVAALVVRLLRRLLDVDEEPRPVLAQAHRAVDDEELLGDVDILEAALVGHRERRRLAVLPVWFGSPVP